MNNVVFSPDIFEVQRYGGVSRYFVELGQKIRSSGEFEVEVSSAIHINSYLKDSSMNTGFYLPFSPSKLRIAKLISKTNVNYSQFLTRKRPFDICHETFYRGGADSLKAKKRVTNVYDLIREKFTPNWSGFAAKQAALSRADAIMCISQATADDLHQYYRVDPSKIDVVYLGVSSKFSKHDESKEKVGSRRQLLYVGGRGGYKDFKTLVMAFAQSNLLRDNFKVLVFGTDFTNEEFRLMQSLKVLDFFSQTTGKDDALISAYRNSIGLVITSIYEGFGLTALEGMMAGCAVISTGGGALGEISGGFDYRFEASNPESLSETIGHLLSNPHSLSEKKDRAQLHANKFTWDKTSRDTLDVYKRVATTM